ncbi:MAG: Uridine kinase [Trizodia sp. TS-e1964]|nr:MAG: Uridine kinase [Trizodia sp. TS-e1964]
MDSSLYSPPWTDTSIIGIAGSSGSGKTSLALEIVSSLNQPWVVVLSMDSFYKTLNPEQSRLAFLNEYDFDSPNAIDFDILVDRLQDIKRGKKAEIPIYSFEKHQRQAQTMTIYSPIVLVLEGIFALYDPRVLELLDVKVGQNVPFLFVEHILKTKVLRDVETRGRDIEGCLKQWFSFVKPNFQRSVEPQRKNADLIVPRGIENKVAIDMIVKHIQRTLKEKSKKHQEELTKLGTQVEDVPLSANIQLLDQTTQLIGMSTILQNPATNQEEFVFYFDRLAALLIEKSLVNSNFRPANVTTPLGKEYIGLHPAGEVSAVVILRAGSALETGLKRVIPDCRTGRLLIQTNFRTGEPALHYLKLPADIDSHDTVLLLDPQLSSGAAALMAVRVLVDHGVDQRKIVFVTWFAGETGVKRLMKVFPEIRVVLGRIVEDFEERWVEKRYFGC